MIAEHILWTACWSLLAGVIAIAAAEDMAGMEGSASRVSFDIQSQPLATALSAYSAATGIGVLVDGRLTEGRASAAVNGPLAPEEALQALLAGTGLMAQYATPTAFTLVPVPADVARSSGPERDHYFVAVQTAIVRALCRQEDIRPGPYRMALQLWIDRSGSVLRSELLSSTGKPERDALVLRQLKNLAVEPPPPAGLPQPVTIVILPRSPEQSADCLPLDLGSRR